jgi:hypothetical protein
MIARVSRARVIGRVEDGLRVQFDEDNIERQLQVVANHLGLAASCADKEHTSKYW